jgi:putative SbcD/Mre11-related phosphoesterase
VTVVQLIENNAALLLTKPERTVVVADLHLGFEDEFRAKGIMIPRESHRIVESLADLCAKERAERVIILGDLKHQFLGASTLEWKTIPRLLKQLKETVSDIMVIPGNHDGGLRKMLGGVATILPAKGYLVEDEGVGLTHGHVRPHESLLRSRIIVTGHMHPVIRLGSDEGSTRLRVWLKMRGDRRLLFQKLIGGKTGRLRGTIQLLIMPSFNVMLAGRSVTELDYRSPGGGPLLRSGVFGFDEADVITLEGVCLGKLGWLRESMHG